MACMRCLVPGSRELFEREFVERTGIRYGIGTSFGRTALYLGLKAAGVAGHEVLLPAFLCSVVRHAVVAAGAIPRFVDVDPDSFEMSINDLKRKISDRARALVLIHYFGRMAGNADEVAGIARERGLLFVEDCAHVLGATRKGVKAGQRADVAIYSLTKNLLNFGGGVLGTERADLCERARAIMGVEVTPRKVRLADFPLVLAYGAEQALQKLDRDRLRRHGTVLARLPGAILATRRSLLGWRGSSGGRETIPLSVTAGALGRTGETRWGYPIAMEALVAALGRSQLKKLDKLNECRRYLAHELGLESDHGRDACQEANVHTFAVLRCKPGRLAATYAAAARRGLLLRATWPTRQQLWEGQETTAVRKIADEVLTWGVHPGLGRIEIGAFRDIVSDLGIDIAHPWQSTAVA